MSYSSFVRRRVDREKARPGFEHLLQCIRYIQLEWRWATLCFQGENEMICLPDYHLVRL